jgi:hypothetical protein
MVLLSWNSGLSTSWYPGGSGEEALERGSQAHALLLQKVLELAASLGPGNGSKLQGMKHSASKLVVMSWMQSRQRNAVGEEVLRKHFEELLNRFFVMKLKEEKHRGPIPISSIVAGEEMQSREKGSNVARVVDDVGGQNHVEGEIGAGDPSLLKTGLVLSPEHAPSDRSWSLLMRSRSP